MKKQQKKTAESLLKNEEEAMAWVKAREEEDSWPSVQ
jgi:hypothetical protein